MSRQGDPRYAALVLAADRTAADAVAHFAGSACKAFAPVAGRPMVLRVVDALQRAALVDDILLCGPPANVLPACPELAQRIAGGELEWCDSATTPAASAMQALRRFREDRPVLLTTADHALLGSATVDAFLRNATASDADVSVGLVRHDAVRALFPAVRRTALRLRGGPYCSCNLFALHTPAARRLVDAWRAVENERKHPRRLVAGLLGPAGVAAYLLGTLSLARALESVSRRLGVKVCAVMLPNPEASVDVDTVADLALAESILRCAPGSASRA